jgi:membrane dipeptidase
MKQNLIGWGITCLTAGVILSACGGKAPAPSQNDRAARLHDEILTVDTHCDTPMIMVREDFDIGKRHAPGPRAPKIDLPKMIEGGLDAEFFAAFVGQGERTPEGYAAARRTADAAIEAVHKMCRDYPDLVGLALTPDDAVSLEKEGRRAAFIGMENGYPLGKDLAQAEEYYKKGVRYITLCHSSDNDICDSSTERGEPEDMGLSDFGRQVVAECNRLGIMVDVSHASDQSFYDILQVTKAPIVATHSSARTLCDHPRNLSDDMLLALKQNGGVVQVCFVSGFVKPEPPNPERDAELAALEEKYGPRREIKDEAARRKAREEYMAIYEKYPRSGATLQDLVDHIDYIVRLIGVDHVGIGTDFDGGGGLEGCNDVSEMPRVTEELIKRGYTDEEIRKIWGGNLMRVFRRVIETAGS